MYAFTKITQRWSYTLAYSRNAEKMLATGHVNEGKLLNVKNLVGKEEGGSLHEGVYYQELTVYSGQMAGSNGVSDTIHS